MVVLYEHLLMPKCKLGERSNVIWAGEVPEGYLDFTIDLRNP